MKKSNYQETLRERIVAFEYGLLYYMLRNMGQKGYLCVEFNPSAFKHGITEEDIRFAFDNKLFDHPIAQQEEKNLLIGLDRQLNPIEILYNEIDENTLNVFHAMKCRKAWRDLAKLEDKLWQE
jgi:hypothetical protein